MPISPLGRPQLESLMIGNGRVTVANGASGASSLQILAAAIVRHDAAGVSSRQTVWELDLAPGEAELVDPPEASDQRFAGIEVLFRLFSSGELGLREVYLASPPDSAPVRQWEAGVRLETEPAEEREFVVPESPGLVAYLRAID
jgi:hypothetical protein